MSRDYDTRLQEALLEIREMREEIAYLNLLLSLTLAHGKLTRRKFIQAMRLLEEYQRRRK